MPLVVEHCSLRVGSYENSMSCLVSKHAEKDWSVSLHVNLLVVSKAC